ncbi:MAG: bifunctional transaldolase/phosoglucose isomerase [Thermoprotei archaeon]
MATLESYARAGQSIWLDYIKRSFIRSGELKSLVDKGLRGATSNPTIFDKAVAGSSDYDSEIARLSAQGKSSREIFIELMLEDVGDAADVFRPVFDRLQGSDGFQSIEVSPEISDDAEAMIREAEEFWRRLARPNVMIKIPATKAGLTAIRRLTAEEVNVNVTLIFSVERYKEVVEAYLSGLEDLASKGGNLNKISSVASFFVSRVDTLVDKELEKKGDRTLQGKIAIANAKVAYAHFKQAFSGERWDRLKAKGARVQRPLWASTSTKNPSYPDTLYVDGLVGPDTVNTVPPQTLDALLDHGRVSNTLEVGLEEARNQLDRLEKLGIDLGEVTQKLLEDGVKAFSDSVSQAVASIDKKRASLKGASIRASESFGSYASDVDDKASELASIDCVEKIWSKDYTLWSKGPQEVSNRLGWLTLPDRMLQETHRLEEFLKTLRSVGVSRALLLGMGGSSLAPRMYSRIFGQTNGGIVVDVLDSTDPVQILRYSKLFVPEETVYIVSSKSGGTVETLSLFKHFYSAAQRSLGNQASNHFIAITDPGTELQRLAEKRKFLACFLADSEVGGRYSALTHFGLVPAAVMAANVRWLLLEARDIARLCRLPDLSANPGLRLGAAIGSLAQRGIDKLTIVTDPEFSSFGDWLEQLVAESTGKDGKGILPVVGEELGDPSVYSRDRFFVYVGRGNVETQQKLDELAAAGHPVIKFKINNNYDLGAEIFRWEFAVAVAGKVIGINPFDQPNVELSKRIAREMLSEYLSTGKLNRPAPLFTLDGISVYSSAGGSSVEDSFRRFLSGVREHGYVSIQAYTDENADSSSVLEKLRTGIRNRYRVATTVGYGPRFLHSTGQLHKGDGGKGVFVQLVSVGGEDCPIPDEAGSENSSTTFGVLELAQALGDRKALESVGRKVYALEVKRSKLVQTVQLLASCI